MPHLQKSDQDYLLKEFQKLVQPVKLIFFTQAFECQYCQITHELLSELAALSDKITLETYDFVRDQEQVKQYQIDKIPAIVVAGERDYGIRFYGVPAGYEFSSLIEDILDVSRGQTDLKAETKKQLAEITQPVHIQVFVTPTCPYCTPAVRMAHKMAIESEWIRGDMVEATEYPQLSNKYFVSAVPKIVINETVEFTGALPEANYLLKVMEAEGSQRASQ